MYSTELNQGQAYQAPQSVVNSAVPTVKIVFPDAPKGWAIIDKSDYNPAEHELYVEPKVTPKKETTEKEPPAK
ncbi:MAG: hypothetical protein RBJ76_13770 [Stenomitos frigidus ULC029]